MSNLDFIENCEHEFVYEGYCESCGFEIGTKLEFESYSYGEYKKIYVPVNNINLVVCISPELKAIVSEKIYNDNKKLSNKLNIFQQVYLSGGDIGELDPDNVSDNLRLSNRILNKSMRAISGTDTHIIETKQSTMLPIVSISPIYLLKDMCNLIDFSKYNLLKLNISSHKEEIKKLIEITFDLEPTLVNDRPKHLTVGFITYYCKCNNIPLYDISNVVNLSKTTIYQLMVKIRKICNSRKIS